MLHIIIYNNNTSFNIFLNNVQRSTEKIQIVIV